MRSKGRTRNTGHARGPVGRSHPCLDYREETVGRGTGSRDVFCLEWE